MRSVLLVIQAAVAVPLIALLLRVVGIRRTKRLLGLADGGQPQSESVPESVRRRAAAVATVVRRSPISVTCLPRALAVAYLARRGGHHVDIVIGVGPATGSGLDAHAWAEYGGIPVNDTADVRDRYSVLAPQTP